MKRIQEEAKAALGKAQEEIKKFANRKHREGEEYRVEDLVLLSTKNLKWQMKGRRSEKLTKHFVGPYKVKGIISSNTIELELPKFIKIHPVVNVSRVQLYKPQVEGQKKIPPKPVIIEGEEEFEVEKILNKRTVRGKEKFLVRWKGYTVEEDTWENKENLENVKELVEEFEREYGKRLKNSGDRNRKKKRRNLVENYLESSQQNYYMAGERKDTKKKKKGDGTKLMEKFLRTRKLEERAML